MSEAIPQKSSYRVSEVCQFTDTQPYILRFWESEFPQLAPDKTTGGQPVYRRKDIDLVLRIKQLLYDEEYTIAAARKQLEREVAGGQPVAAPPQKAAAPRRKAEHPEPRPVGPSRERVERATTPPAETAFDSVSRERYEDAVDEIAHLRLMLSETESTLRRTEAALGKAEEEAAHHRQRVESSIAKLEALLERLTV